jgi:hypothetical protein
MICLIEIGLLVLKNIFKAFFPTHVKMNFPLVAPLETLNYDLYKLEFPRALYQEALV